MEGTYICYVSGIIEAIIGAYGHLPRGEAFTLLVASSVSMIVGTILMLFHFIRTNNND